MHSGLARHRNDLPLPFRRPLSDRLDRLHLLLRHRPYLERHRSPCKPHLQQVHHDRLQRVDVYRHRLLRPRSLGLRLRMGVEHRQLGILQRSVFLLQSRGDLLPRQRLLAGGRRNHLLQAGICLCPSKEE